MFNQTRVPNLALPRVQAKCKALLDLVDELELYGPRSITQVELTKLLGNQTKPIGAFLRLGLERFGSYTPGSSGYSYRPNHEFCDRLRAQLSTPPAPILEVAKRVNRVFSPSKRHEHKKTGHRYYPWWSWMQTEKMEELFLAQYGQMFRYDMEASQPTIVLQLYERMLNPVLAKHSPKHQVPTWRAYVENRTYFRQKLSQDIGEPVGVIKDVLQSVTNGGYATTSPKNPICHMLGEMSTHKLLQHELYQGLLKDYRVMRTVLFPDTPVKGVSKQLYHAYERVEDVIMALIDRELKVDAWFIHDGFFTHTRIQKAELEAKVKEVLGFTIKLEEKTIPQRSRELHI